jgi:hypothetical protein
MRRSFNRVSDPNVVDDGKWMTVGMIKVFSDGRDVLNLATTISASTRVAARLRKKACALTCTKIYIQPGTLPKLFTINYDSPYSTVTETRRRSGA